MNIKYKTIKSCTLCVFERGLLIIMKGARTSTGTSLLVSHQKNIPCNIIVVDKNDYKQIEIIKDDNSYHNWINVKTGKLVNNIKYYNIGFPSEGWAFEFDNNYEYNWINMVTGKPLSEKRYNRCYDVHNGWGRFMENLPGYKHYYNWICMEDKPDIGKKVGDKFNDVQYKEAGDFRYGWAYVFVDVNTYQYIDESGQFFKDDLKFTYTASSDYSKEKLNFFAWMTKRYHNGKDVLPAIIISSGSVDLIIDFRGVAYYNDDKAMPLSIDRQGHYLRKGYEFDTDSKKLMYNGEILPDNEQPFA